MTSTLILGASDPEMACIEELASSAGWRVLHAAALGRNGVLGRVFGGGAYQATAVLDSGTGEVVPCPDAPVVLVECGGPALDSADVVARCDHHNPGDPGYGRPPTEFLPASSLGQAIRLLAVAGEIPADWRRLDASGWIEAPRPGDVAVYGAGILAVRAPEGVAAAIPLRLLLTAAGDHCLGAAYAGQCPGVDPAALIAHRRDEKAAWLASLPTTHPARREVEACAPGRPLREAVDAAAARTTAALLAAPSLAITAGPPGTRPPVVVRDVRDIPPLPLLPDVAAELGIPSLYRMPPSPHARDQRVKVGITGGGGTAAGTAAVEAFLGGWAAAQGISGCYPALDPNLPPGEALNAAAARGYAGGYEEQP